MFFFTLISRSCQLGFENGKDAQVSFRLLTETRAPRGGARAHCQLACLALPSQCFDGCRSVDRSVVEAVDYRQVTRHVHQVAETFMCVRWTIEPL